MRCAEAISVIWHTGHSDETHSPDEWARMVVRRSRPASLSISVVWTSRSHAGRGSCARCRTRSTAGHSGSVRSASRGNGDRMVATSDFSGLVSSHLRLGEGSRNGADCIHWSGAWLPPSALRTSKLTAPDFERFARNPMPDRLLGVLRHEALELRLGVLMLEVGLACAPKYAGEFGPSV